MGILNLNGGVRKDALPKDGSVFTHSSAPDHPQTGIQGKTYQSPFTEESNPPMSGQFNNATLPQVPALQVGEAGQVGLTKNFQKVQPHERGTHFKPTDSAKKKTTFMPSVKNDVPMNPNQKAPKKAPQVLRPNVASEKIDSGSFLETHAQSLTIDPNNDASVSRWSTTKKGAAG